MGKRWGWRVCGDHSTALGSHSSLTPRGTEGTENLQSQNLSGREVQENHAGWQLHPSGLPGKPALLCPQLGSRGSKLAGLPGLLGGGGRRLQTAGLKGQAARPWVGPGTRPKTQLDLKPFKYLGIWYIPFKYLNIFFKYFIIPFKYLASWSPFVVWPQALLWNIQGRSGGHYDYYDYYNFCRASLSTSLKDTWPVNAGGRTRTHTFCLCGPACDLHQEIRRQHLK